MVTFNCEVCNDTVPKKNTEKHYYRCPDAYYTCIDCSKTFDDGVSYKQHTQCISEDEKYQGALYKGKKKQQQQQQQQQKQKQQPQKPVKKEDKKEDKKPAKKEEKIGLKKGDNLYKILKNYKSKYEKKKFLKSLVVDADGRLVMQN